MSRYPLVRTLFALGAIATVAVSGCSSTDHTSSDSGTSAPTGPPITIGMSNTELGAFSDPSVTVGAQAAIKYINGRGGIQGRPLALDLCKTDGTTATSAACANQFISDKVTVDLEGLDYGADAKLAPLKAAGIPIFGIESSGNATLGDPYATITSVSTALGYQGALTALKSEGAQKVVIVGPDQGAQLKQVFDSVIIPSAKAMGMDAAYTTFNPAAPDFTVAVTSARATGADTIAITGSEGDCTSAIKTARTLGFTGRLFATFCTKYVTALGNQAKGVTSIGYIVPASARASAPAAIQSEIDTYQAAMKADGKSSSIAGFSAYGFSSVMTLATGLEAIAGPIDSDTAKAALAKFTGDVFLGQRQVDCTHRPGADGTCGTAIAVFEAKGDGSVDLVNGAFLNLK